MRGDAATFRRLCTLVGNNNNRRDFVAEFSFVNRGPLALAGGGGGHKFGKWSSSAGP